jgi:tetratricopeptide (TPR) repeat protein
MLRVAPQSDFLLFGLGTFIEYNKGVARTLLFLPTGTAVATSRNRIRRMRLQHQAEGYLELGMPRQALDLLARLGESDGSDTHSFYLQGEALRALERYDDALVPLGRVAEAEPENIHVWLALGWCHKRCGRIDLAIDALETALAVDADEPLVRYNLACYWSLAGGKRQALGYLEQALAIDPDYCRLVDYEPDFDPIRSDPEFQAVCEGSRTHG